jgi:hypothetical protein
MIRVARVFVIVALATGAAAAEGAPIGFWRATNECFLALLFIAEDGHAQAAYLSGERDDNAMWTWDGSTLKVSSPMFPEDEFTGHLATKDRVEADYAWHDLDRDQLNRQACVFERVMPFKL